MIQRIVLIVTLSICSLFASGQFDPFVSLHMFNQMYYNPGYAGDGNEIEAKILNRQQWIGFEGAPNSTFLNVDAPFKLFNQRHGAGLSIMRDNIGNFGNTGVNLSYAYRRNLIQGDLGIGIGLNMLSSSFEGTWVTPEASEDQDPSIPATSETPLVIDMNLGLFYRSDNLFLSLSSRNLANSKMKYKGENKKNSYIGRQVFFSTGYDYQLPNPMYSLKPVVFVASDFSSTQLAVNGIVTYNKRFFGGVGMKVSNSVSDVTVMAGVDLPSGIEVAVSYDISTSRMQKVSNGSFEFMLGYSFSLDVDKDNRKYKSVRFL